MTDPYTSKLITRPNYGRRACIIAVHEKLEEKNEFTITLAPLEPQLDDVISEIRQNDSELYTIRRVVSLQPHQQVLDQRE